MADDELAGLSREELLEQILLLLMAYVILWITMSIGLFATSHTVVDALDWSHRMLRDAGRSGGRWPGSGCWPSGWPPPFS